MAECKKTMMDDIREDMISHDERVIRKKKAAQAEHEKKLVEEIGNFGKKVQEAEIKHDERVIERKEEAIEKHEDKMAEHCKDDTVKPAAESVKTEPVAKEAMKPAGAEKTGSDAVVVEEEDVEIDQF